MSAPTRWRSRAQCRRQRRPRHLPAKRLVRGAGRPAPFDVIVSNPPYIASGDHHLSEGLRGIERETLRVDPGHLARTAHPVLLGSALTHPQITTDYAEALLEFITPAEHDIGLALHRLDAIHRYAYSKLGDEMLWSQSMPCDLPAEEDIEIAWYGKSNIGMLKHVYRRGLALRYGKAMQCIAGIHYNYSLPEQLWKVLAESEGIPEERRRRCATSSPKAISRRSATSAATAGC
jgi:glutamate--cysteine ligase